VYPISVSVSMVMSGATPRVLESVPSVPTTMALALMAVPLAVSLSSSDPSMRRGREAGPLRAGRKSCRSAVDESIPSS
jgi:hypothetical protein